MSKGSDLINIVSVFTWNDLRSTASTSSPNPKTAANASSGFCRSVSRWQTGLQWFRNCVEQRRSSYGCVRKSFLSSHEFGPSCGQNCGILKSNHLTNLIFLTKFNEYRIANVFLKRKSPAMSEKISRIYRMKYLFLLLHDLRVHSLVIEQKVQ